MKELEEYAKRKFYDLQNRWRKDISAGDDKYKTKLLFRMEKISRKKQTTCL